MGGTANRGEECDILPANNERKTSFNDRSGARESFSSTGKTKGRYDQTARSRQFGQGDRVLVLLPTSTHKLRAQWQGPFTVIKRKGDVDYVVDVGDRRKRLRTFHINMLRKWHENKPLSLYTDDVVEEETDDVILWHEENDLPPVINHELLEGQTQDMKQIISDYKDVFSTKPGRTHLTEHRIDAGTAHPIRQMPYRLPHAYSTEGVGRNGERRHYRAFS